MRTVSSNSLASTRLKALDAGTIHELFGSFDAESEELERFKEYFVANDFYETFTADFPLRIVVGNKGAGKSALLRASLIDSQTRPDVVSIPLSASDLIARADSLPRDGLKAINHWKAVFATEAAGRLLTSWIPASADGDLARTISNLGDFFTWIARVTSKRTKGASDIAIRSGVDLNHIKKLVFYIDDLDKGWDGRYEGLHFVNSILNACYDISRKERNIGFKIAIRWDLWDAISRINQDIDKIRQNTTFLRWSNHEIYVVMATRVAKFFGIEFAPALYLSEERKQEEIAPIFDPILERTFHGLGKWDGAPSRRVILSMTRSRPRDLLTLLSLAAAEAHKKRRTHINSADLQTIFPRYSEDRLNDLIVEYGTRLVGMEALLLSFKPSQAAGKLAGKFRFTNDRIAVHLKGVLGHNTGRVHFTYEKGAPDFRRILDFLYRIDFLQAWYH
jgi:hypothetical protein